MAIRQISLSAFRKLGPAEIDFHQQLNLITGDNGSGKTSLLEAIHILTQGRSFKTLKLDHCINHDKGSFLLFARFGNHKVGIQRKNKETIIHIDGDAINKLSTLASLIPIKAIHSQSFELVSSSPSNKREFIDWCMFHVEHRFSEYWVSFVHALKQRNALLKKRNQMDLLPYWDDTFVKAAIPVYEMRKKYVDQIAKQISEDSGHLLHDMDIQLQYEPGWKETQDLHDILIKSRDRDIKYGFTHHGPHRDNIAILNAGLPVQNHLSRGQLKRLTVSLLISQVRLVKQLTNKNMIILLDDLTSELDDDAIKIIFEALNRLGVQLFVTAVTNKDCLIPETQEYKMFHVEHGIISAVNNR